LRILIINKHLRDYLGGSEVQSDIIASRLSERGHKIIYLAVNGFQKDYSVPYKVIGTTLNFLKLISIIKVEHPDIIYWRYNRTKLLKSVIAAKLCRMKFVFAISGPSDFEIWIKRKRNNLRLFKLIKHTIGSVFYEIDYLLNYLGFYFIDGVITQLNNQTNKLPVSREITIPNSVNLTYTSFAWNRPYVVWVSNLKSTKNPEAFLKLAKEFQDSSTDFIMVGKIQDKKYEIVLDDATKPSNLYYLGFKTVEETNGIIANSLFLVHTCDPEGFPNVMIQAWSFGKPTISLYYDPDDLIYHNQLGSISRNFETLVSDTAKYIEDRSLVIRVGLKAKEFSRSHFNSQVNSVKIESFLQGFLGKQY